MKISCFPYGPLASNMYLIDTHSSFFIVDPSVYPDQIPDDKKPASLTGILITHGHFDHINALDKWMALYPDTKAYMSAKDIEMIEDPGKNGSEFFAELCSYKSKVADIMDLKLDNLKVIETPGHSKGSICLLFEEDGEKVLFTGDTLFADSVGRTDLYGGSSREQMDSIDVLRNLSADAVVLPGHGPSSTIERELKYNPFFNF